MSRDEFTNTAAWTDKLHYYLSNHPQGSKLWHLCRTFRLTASNMGTAVGVNKWENKYQLALYIVKLIEKTFPPDAIERMAHGTRTEPVARDRYELERGVKVEEVGLAVPKWETRVGASVDGDITDGPGIIEIKCPKIMYDPIRKHMYRIMCGYKPEPYEYEHITPYYYVQMQANMRVLGKDWCDYIVYATDSNLMYIERVLFNKQLWDLSLWPLLLDFLDNILGPVVELMKTFFQDYVDSYHSLKDGEKLTWAQYIDKRDNLKIVVDNLNNPAHWNEQCWKPCISWLTQTLKTMQV